jgi:hypothetical protein
MKNLKILFLVILLIIQLSVNLISCQEDDSDLDLQIEGKYNFNIYF